jgi:hypothetical protein
MELRKKKGEEGTGRGRRKEEGEEEEGTLKQFG